MTNDQVLGIQKELRQLADKKIAEHSQRFFKTAKGQYGHGAWQPLSERRWVAATERT